MISRPQINLRKGHAPQIESTGKGNVERKELTIEHKDPPSEVIDNAVEILASQSSAFSENIKEIVDPSLSVSFLKKDAERESRLSEMKEKLAGVFDLEKMYQHN